MGQPVCFFDHLQRDYTSEAKPVNENWRPHSFFDTHSNRSSKLMLNWSHGLSSDKDAQQLLEKRILTSIYDKTFS